MKKYWHKLILMGLLIIGTLFRLIGSGNPDFWRDEAFTIRVADRSFGSMVEILKNDTAPPLHTIMLHYVIKIFGVDAFWIRFPSFVFGILSLFLVYKVSGLIFKSKRLIYLVTLFAALNPVLIFYSQEARNYSLFLALSLAALFFTLRIFKNQDFCWQNLLGLFISTVLGLYTHNLFLFIAFVNGLLVLIGLVKHRDKSWRSNFSRLVITYFLIGMFYLPWFIVFLSQADTVSKGGFWLHFKPLKDIFSLLVALFKGEKWPNDYPGIISLFAIFSPAIALGLFGVSIWLIVKTKNILIKYLLFWFTANALIVWLYAFKTSFFYIRYLIYLVPAYLIFVGFAIFRLSKLSKIFALILTIILVGSLTTIDIYNASNMRNSKTKMTELVKDLDYREGDLILHSSAYTHHAFNVYSDLPNQVYDPNDDISYFAGVAVLQESDYYRMTEIVEPDRVWAIYLWDEPKEMTDELVSQDYVRQFKNDYTFNLHLELWIKD